MEYFGIDLAALEREKKQMNDGYVKVA